MVILEEVDKLKVNELKAACKELGLEQSGNKADLIARLKAALAEQPGADGTDAGAAPAEASVPAAEEAAPAADAAADAAQAPAEKPEVVAATAAPAAGGGRTRARIEFTETEAVKAEATKVTVVNTAEAADKPKQMTEAEKVRIRKDRFKDPDTERLKQRAQRFNVVDANLEKDKALKRAERFGTQHPELELIKKEQRAARFGIVDEETKKKQRLDKFKPLPADKPDFGVAVKQDDDFEAKRK
ncbi:SAP domain-containing ribonucleoprotein, partial [Tetrabaena socialis]